MIKYLAVAVISSISIPLPASAAIYIGPLSGYVKSGFHSYETYPGSGDGKKISAVGKEFYANILPDPGSPVNMFVSGALIGGSVYDADLLSFEEALVGIRYSFRAWIVDFNGNDGCVIALNGILRNNKLLSWYGNVGMSGQAHEDNKFWNTNVTVSSFAYVPEPATWALMLLGFGTVGGAMRLRNKIAIRFT